jgi:UDP-N-acetylmuramate dehydrogenase
MKVSRISLKTIKKLNNNGENYKDYPLSKLTTFKVGGKAKYFIKICTLENFIKVMIYLNSKKYPYYILGNGSNILASDRGYNGIIIKLSGDFDRVLVRENEMECGAGVLLAKAYLYARNNNLSGFESSVGIPASIGGATVMNASAYDFEMSKIIKYVVAYYHGKITYLKNLDCEFGYRKSIFQSGEYVILRVGFKLIKDSQDLIIERHNETLAKRKELQSVGFPSAGCVFKNIKGLTVSRMLDEMGAKKYSCGGAEVSDKHANFIINKNKASANDIYLLMNKLSLDFYDKYGINLDTEIKFLGEFDEINR